MQKARRGTITSILLLAVLSLVTSAVFAATKTRTCGSNPGQTLQHFLDELNPGDTLIVSGNCGSVVIGEGARNLTIEAQGATINASATPTISAVQIRGRAIIIKGFTIIGGRHGVQVSRGGTATIDTNVIRNGTGHGVLVNDNSFARIVDNTIEQNAQNGICVCEHASAEIGFRGESATQGSPNIVRNNAASGILVSDASYAEIESNSVHSNLGTGIAVNEGSTARIGFQSGFVGTFSNANTVELNGNRGILVARSSTARIVGNVIKNNTGDGVGIIRVSQADVASNVIDGNSANGVLVSQNSGVNLGNDTGGAPQDQPNSTAANNTLSGVSCQLNSYADGRQGTLNGNLGPQNFGASCSNSVIP
jgi:hypothetical protein